MFFGEPKQPTWTIGCLSDRGLDEKQALRHNDRIVVDEIEADFAKLVAAQLS